MTSNDRIKSRLRTEEHLVPWRRKCHSLRMMVAGDYSSIDDSASPQNDPSGIGGELHKDMAGLYDALVTDFSAGTSNKMLQALMTLVQQSAFRFPDIEFEDAHPLEQAVNALYLKKRLGARPHGCDAVPHMRLALWHYVIDGIGWVWCGVRDGKPTVSRVDSMDVVWDTTVDLVTDMRWIACRWKDTLAYWIEMYGEKPFKDLLGGDEKARDKALERTVELWFYYDVDGPKGTHAVYRMGSEGPYGEPIEKTDNPHSMDVDGLQVPFLPLEPMFYTALPSVRNPIGIAELMIASQLALRKAEKNMNAAVERGAPWISVETGAYETDELDKLAEGEPGEIVKHNSGKNAATIQPAIEIPESVLGWYNINQGEIFASSGANPYSAGDKVSGVQYAAEVNAIQGAASLRAATIAQDHADQWRRVAKKCLANGVKYDVLNITLILDGDELKFGPENPIGPYLRPDADPVIAEDTLAFAPREKRIQDAMNGLNSALLVASLFPNSVRLSYERLLLASGVRDTAAYLEAPPTVTGPPGGAPEGGLDPAADAAASSAS